MTEIFDSFVEKMKKLGAARKNNFYVRIDISSKLPPFLKDQRNGTFYQSDYGATLQNIFPPERQKSISFMCNKASISAKETELDTQVYKPGYQIKMSRGQKPFEDLELTFQLSTDLNEKRFFDTWFSMVVDPFSLEQNYYDEYAKGNYITVFALPRSFAGTIVDENTLTKDGFPIYWAKYYDCFPTKVGNLDYSWGEQEAAELTVSFSYKYMRTISDFAYPQVDTQGVFTINGREI